MRPFYGWLYQRTLALGWVWPFMFSAGAAFFTSFIGSDPLMWRSFSSTDPLMQTIHLINGTWAGYSDHHFLSLTVVAILFFALAASFAKSSTGGTFIKRYYSFGLLATFASIWVWALHEGMWWICYIIFTPVIYGWTIQAKWFTGFGEIVCFALVAFTIAFDLYFPKKFAVCMAAFYVAWVAVGFPITISYLGNTSLYYTIWANAWENGSWAFACAAFFIFERKDILKWWNGVCATVHGPVKF